MNERSLLLLLLLFSLKLTIVKLDELSISAVADRLFGDR